MNLSNQLLQFEKLPFTNSEHNLYSLKRDVLRRLLEHLFNVRPIASPVSTSKLSTGFKSCCLSTLGTSNCVHVLHQVLRDGHGGLDLLSALVMQLKEELEL